MPALLFLLALIATVLTLGGITAGGTAIAELLFFVFLVLFLVSLALGVGRRDNP